MRLTFSGSNVLPTNLNVHILRSMNLGDTKLLNLIETDLIFSFSSQNKNTNFSAIYWLVAHSSELLLLLTMCYSYELLYNKLSLNICR